MSFPYPDLQPIDPDIRALRDRLGRFVAADAVPAGVIPPEGARLIRAAVLVPVVERADGLALLLTKRTDHLHDHPGQVSFPGGRCEESDESPVATALREAEEEIGLAPRHVDVIGVLPEYRTGTGFCVTPVVGVVSPPFSLTLDTFEVAEVFEAPLRFLLDPANRKPHEVMHEGRLRRFFAMPYNGYYIWGATAGMIVSLHRLMVGQSHVEGDL